MKKLPANRLIPNPFRFRAFFTQTLLLFCFVFLIVAVKECPLGIAFARQDMGGNTVEEPAIMGDDGDAAGEFGVAGFTDHRAGATGSGLDGPGDSAGPGCRSEPDEHGASDFALDNVAGQ